MKLKIFAVYDSKAEAFMTPFFMHARGQAIRSFGDSASDGKSVVNQHPADFTLFELGEYDDSNASISTYATPVSLGLATELINK